MDARTKLVNCFKARKIVFIWPRLGHFRWTRWIIDTYNIFFIANGKATLCKILCFFSSSYLIQPPSSHIPNFPTKCRVLRIFRKLVFPSWCFFGFPKKSNYLKNMTMIRGKVFGRRVKISPLSFPSQPGRPKEPLYCGVGKTRNSDDGNDDDLVGDCDWWWWWW